MFNFTDACMGAPAPCTPCEPCRPCDPIHTGHSLPETVEATRRKLYELMQRMQDYQRQLETSFAAQANAISADNETFKRTYMETHAQFLREVQAEINAFESRVNATVDIYTQSQDIKYSDMESKLHEYCRECVAGIQEKIDGIDAFKNDVLNDFNVRFDEMRADYNAFASEIMDAMNEMKTAADGGLSLANRALIGCDSVNLFNAYGRINDMGDGRTETGWTKTATKNAAGVPEITITQNETVTDSTVGLTKSGQFIEAAPGTVMRVTANVSAMESTAVNYHFNIDIIDADGTNTDIGTNGANTVKQCIAWQPGTISETFTMPESGKVLVTVYTYNCTSATVDCIMICPDALPDTGFVAFRQPMAQAVADLRKMVIGRGMKIPSGADLNEYTTTGVYTFETAAIAATLINSPTKAYGGSIHVVETIGASRVAQFMILNTAGYFYMRTYLTAGWSKWYKFTGEEMTV